MALDIEAVTAGLPVDFEMLRAEARVEGFRQIERLATEWQAGTTRFDRDGEALLAARVDGVLAGIGGLTLEPVVPGALRMRRFYVRPAYRRLGVGRALVFSLVARLRPDQAVTTNAAPGSIPFWEAIGFTPDPSAGHTHILRGGNRALHPLARHRPIGH